MNQNISSTCIVVLVALLPFAPIAGAEDRIASLREGGKLFLKCADVADTLNFDLKIIQPGQLATFCRGRSNGICIPVRLSAENHIVAGKDLLVAADVLSGALRFEVVEDAGTTVTISRQTGKPEQSRDDAPPAYNATWEKDRGFGKGDTLPDIPLVDLNGNEVRFSQFLGKRYILYVWASW